MLIHVIWCPIVFVFLIHSRYMPKSMLLKCARRAPPVGYWDNWRVAWDDCNVFKHVPYKATTRIGEKHQAQLPSGVS